jgi:branched-chain amino acid aminotransferase
LTSSTSDHSHRSIWIDGSLCPWAEATVHVLAHCLQRGSLVFDYMSVHDLDSGTSSSGMGGASIFRLREHIDRFFHSCELMGLPVEYSADELGAAICDTVRANPGAKAVKISAYFASIEIDVVPVDGHVTVSIAAYDPKADILDHFENPPPPRPTALKLWIEKELANRRDDILAPQAKVSANYASPMTAKARARAQGFDEIILVDEDGHLAEGPTANLFLVDSSGTLLTPPSAKVLHGVTRSTIIDLAKAEGIPFREAPLLPAALLEATEAFLTGTTAGVWPVESVDRKRLDTCPGPISTTLLDRFLRVVRGEDSEYAHWLTPVNDE